MRVLVSSSSRHGSTREIAHAIGETLKDHGHDVASYDASDAPPIAEFDAAVLGSAVYMGSWLPDARAYIERNAAALATRPVWLFSSGPLGEDDPQPKGDPAIVAELLASTNARGHANFVGRLDRQGLAWHERLVVEVVRAPYGDFRDWSAIRTWASGIATELQTPAAAGPSTKIVPDDAPRHGAANASVGASRAARTAG